MLVSTLPTLWIQSTLSEVSAKEKSNKNTTTEGRGTANVRGRCSRSEDKGMHGLAGLFCFPEAAINFQEEVTKHI